MGRRMAIELTISGNCEVDMHISPFTSLGLSVLGACKLAQDYIIPDLMRFLRRLLAVLNNLSTLSESKTRKEIRATELP